MTERQCPTYVATATFAVAALILWASPVLALESDEVSQLRTAIASFSEEPDIQDVQRQVLKYRNFDGARPDRWTRRARASNLLPRIQGQANWLDQRDRQDQFRENIDTDDLGAYEPDNAQHQLRDYLRVRSVYSLRVTFDLSELVYSSDEMAIQREVRNRWSMHDELIERVTEMYFARRRHQLYLRLFPDDQPEKRLDRHLQIEALTARIDALTGGWFRQQLQETP